jgi:hypothetical protein
LALLALGAAPAAVRAQAVCAGQIIRDIRVQTAALFAIEREPFPRFLQSIGNGLNWQTRPATVRRELRIAAGEPCDPARLAESARILRAQSYLRSADLVTTPAPGGAVDVEVQTRDDWALGGSIRIDTDSGRVIKAARLTEDNLFGLGMLAQLRYDYFGRRAGLVLDLLHRQVFGHNDGELVVGRTSVGPVGELSLRRTFESEYDRYGWRAAARYRKEPFVLKSNAFGTVSLPMVSSGVDLGLARRSGPRGRQTMVGVALSMERLTLDGTAFASRPSDDSAANAQVAGRYTERRRVAFNIFWGYRNLRYVPHGGLDAVNAREDVREGFELRLIGGRTVSGSGGLQQDWFALVDGYAGTPLGGRTLAFVRGRAEGRYLIGTKRWEGVLIAASAYSYTAVSPRGTVAVGLQAAGGWHMDMPYQLLLGSTAAMRGFGLAAFPAGRRVVAQAEHRYLLGTLFGAVDIGSALFLDVGRGWAGDALFGADTGTLIAAGAGVRLGLPSGSRFTSRLDLAVPVRGGRRVEVRLTLRRQFGVTSGEPDDVERSRTPVSTIDLFHFTRY